MNLYQTRRHDYLDEIWTVELIERSNKIEVSLYVLSSHNIKNQETVLVGYVVPVCFHSINKILMICDGNGAILMGW